MGETMSESLLAVVYINENLDAQGNGRQADREIDNETA